MSYLTLVGAQFAISSGLDAAKTVSAMTNASPPVATITAHGWSNNDEILFLNDWEEFNESVFRISGVATNTANLTDYDSSNTTLYPAGGGVGTAAKVSGWTALGQVLAISPSGGDASFEEVKPFEKRNGVKVFTGFSASSLELTLGWDRSRTDQQSIQTSSRVAGKRVIRFALPGGVYAYAYGTVSASALPTFENILKQKVVFTMSGIFTSF